MPIRVQRDPDLYNAGWGRKIAPRLEHVRKRATIERAVLTPRECEVLMLVSEGLSVKVIARRLCISASTVKGHLTRIFDALDMRTAAGAVGTALREGLIP